MAVERVDDRRDVVDVVLAIGVERDDARGPATDREVDAGLERGALAQVDRVAEDDGATGACLLAGAVTRAIVDDDDRPARLDDGRDDTLDDAASFPPRSRSRCPAVHRETLHRTRR